MRDFEEYTSGDYKGRDIKAALAEARYMVDTILTAPDQTPLELRKEIALKTVRNFRDHINKGFLDYRKSVTEATSFAVTEWTGQGSILVDALDRQFIDLLGGFGLYSYGIRHPKIIEAVKAQLDRSPQYSQEMLDPLRAQLAKVLALLSPGKIQYGFFANSGTEAVEGAMKLAKLYTGKKGFIAMLKGFHGKTLGSLSLMGKKVFREPLLPLLEGVRHVPFGDAEAVEKALAAAKAVGDGIAAVVAEPVQGEAGAVVPPDDYWPRLREICNHYGVLLIADEVQTGMGRTGKIFGVDHWDVAPDIMCLGKALGGGVVGDLAGFVAATYMRGVPYLQVPTTLLAMVDASVGGKTGVDLSQGKNLVGAFKQPVAVVVDPTVLATLEEAEFRSGMAEVIKHGIIGDAALFAELETPKCNTQPAMSSAQIVRALQVKVEVVADDPYEQGRRAVLNLGHTVGHGLEKLSAYSLRHGEAVSVGMVAAARIAVALGRAGPAVAGRIEATLAAWGLPVRCPDFSSGEIWHAMAHDKKRRGRRLRWVLPRAIGQVELCGDVPEETVKSVLRELGAS